MSLALSGIGVSRGIAIGKAHVLQHDSLEILEYAIPPHLLEDEIRRFEKAVVAARRQLKSVRDRIPQDTRPEIAEFIDTHVLMLEDATFTTAPIELIRARRCNAESNCSATHWFRSSNRWMTPTCAPARMMLIT